MMLLSVGLYFYALALDINMEQGFLISLFVLGLVIGVAGLLVGGFNMYKCDYCHRRFDNKADCIKHEKAHKRK